MRNLRSVSASSILLLVAASASAAPSLQYQVLDGSTLIGSGSTTAGAITVSGSDGRFSVFGNGVGAPLLTAPGLSSSVFSIQSNASASAATLTIRLSATGLTGYAGGSVMNAFTLNSLNGGSFGSGTISTYLDNSNSAYGTGTLLATSTYAGLGSFSDTLVSAAAPSATFSETAILTLNYAAGGTSTVSASAQVTPVQATPEPSALAALGIGALALLRRRRRA